MPTFAASYNAVSPSARPPTNNDMVNPMPASQAAPKIARHDVPAGNSAQPSFTAIQLNSITPAGLPMSNPATTPSATRSASAPTPARATPALAKANNGMMA